MSAYNIVSTGSGEVVNVFEWNGIDDIYIPPGFTTSLNTTESIELTFVNIESSSFDFTPTNNIVGNLLGDVYATIIEGSEVFTNKITSQELIQFGEAIISGSTQFSGSVNITGSLFINDKKIETLLNGTKYGKLAFNSGTDLNVDPPLASFRFPTDPNDWNIPVSRITMDYWNSWFIERNDTYEQLRNYAIKVAQVIVNADNSCVMTLRSETNPNTFKKFRIIGGTYYVYNSGPNTCSQINWGQRTFTQSPSINCDRFDEERYATENEQMWFNTWNTTDRTTDFWTKLIEPGGYFDLDVEELDSNHDWTITTTNFESGIQIQRRAESYEQPDTAYYNEKDESENDWFWVDFEHDAPLGYKRKQVFEFRSTVTPWQVPSWADELTIYAIGGGGGGGGGASGHGMHLVREFLEQSSLYLKSYNGIDLLNEKVLLKTAYDENRRGADIWPDGSSINIFDENIEIVDKSGHAYVTGGGGGAGGNVAVSKLKISDGNISAIDMGKTVIPRSSKLNIYVGVGGSGGEGSSYKDDINIELGGGVMQEGKQESYKWIQYPDGTVGPNLLALNRTNWYLSRLGLKLPDPIDKLLNYPMYDALEPSWNKWQRHPDWQNISFFPEYYTEAKNGHDKFYYKKMTSIDLKHFGKKGGFSSVELSGESNTVTNIGVEMVKATGGFGGLAGWAIKVNIPDTHRICSSVGHMFNEFYVPGGGSNIDASFGNLEVRPGGHGGYGVSMPTLEKNPDSRTSSVKRRFAYRDFPMNPIAQNEAEFRGYEWDISRDYTFSTKTVMRIAPAIPWSSNYNNRLNYNFNGLGVTTYSLPWGSTVDVNYSNWENEGYKVYDTTSTIKPELPAPLGGSGGVGVTWVALSDENPYTVHSIDTQNIKSIGPSVPTGEIRENRPSYIERVLFSKINGVTITSDDVDDYHPPYDVFDVQSRRIVKNVLHGEFNYYDQSKLGYSQTTTRPIIDTSKITPNLFSTVTRINSNNNGTYTFKFGTLGADGGFGNYIKISGQPLIFNETDNEISGPYEVLPEDGYMSGEGGGGGAARYVTDWNEKDTANITGQNGGNGAGGIVVIVAEEL